MDRDPSSRPLGPAAMRRLARRGLAAVRRLARRARRRTLVLAGRAARRLRPHVPLLGGAALMAATVLSGLWTTGRLPWPGPGDDARAGVRACAVDRPARLADRRSVLFGGAFADRPAWADADVATSTRILRREHGRSFRVYLDRAARYEEWIRPVLARYGVPGDFLWLAVIESGLNPEAHSRMGAVGPWQFVRFTAREQGLRVTWSVDERRDPLAATDAAARYLARLRRAFGSWALAAAAYNAGPRRVGRALRRCRCDTFWELARTRILARETRNFVPKLVAAARVGDDPLGHGLASYPRPAPLTFRTVEVEPASRLDAVARAAGTTVERVRRLNPHLLRGLTPARPPSRVRLPPETVGRFRTAWAGIPEEERRAGAVHLVRRRETLSEIARDYGVSVRAIRAANESLDPRRLRPGQRIRVPAGSL